ncbi:coronin-2A isoform X3 [Silurus meridionalis]|uniref:coronin-2A isoform X3 n=1 Tax=Silurus meridionalis TaxID=175797 RepID=UPI001EEA3324|nr:coronin-2A isoform X3 [Silurus meridionalis]
MSWRPAYQGSKFRHVYGKPASKGQSYDGLPITHGVHDNHCCAINPLFIAVVTECAGGGAFIVISIRHKGRVDPHHPRVCGHSARVLDVKWDPFDDQRIASCSEDCTVKVWQIPSNGLKENLTKPQKELLGHIQRVGLIEWHPTAKDILLSSAYDYKVCIWCLDHVGVAVLKTPVLVIHTHTDLVMSVSFSEDGSRIATTCRDRRVRILEPRTGHTLQESCNASHKAIKTLFLSNVNLLLTTGTSKWNQRQFALWDLDDLSEPLLEEDVDGGSGVLFPFYDPDTHMLYLAGKGDGNIRYYEVSVEKPYIHFLAEYRSPLPHKGLGPVLMSLRPVIKVQNPYPAPEQDAQLEYSGCSLDLLQKPYSVEEPANQTAGHAITDLSDWQEDETQWNSWRDTHQGVKQYESETYTPWAAEKELLNVFYKQQGEIRCLRQQLRQRDSRIQQLELEIKNIRNQLRASF